MGIDNEKYLDTLTDALGRSDGQSVEEVKDELRSEGVDVDGAISRLKMAREHIAMAAKRTALDAARKKRLKLSDQAHSFIGKFKDWTEEQIIDKIKELGGPQAGLAYRDLETMGIEEKASILEDLEMTKARAREDDKDEK